MSPWSIVIIESRCELYHTEHYKVGNRSHFGGDWLQKEEALGGNQSRRGSAKGEVDLGSWSFFFNRKLPRSAYEQHDPSLQNDMSQQTSFEEQEYIARYLVVKHSWRGRYKRILCISESSIITLDPNTLSVTNAYESSDFDGAAPVLGRDELSNEFTITARTDSRSKYRGIRFSSMFQTSILTELHRIKWSKMTPIAEFSVLHLRRRTSEWIPYVRI